MRRRPHRESKEVTELRATPMGSWRCRSDPTLTPLLPCRAGKQVGSAEVFKGDGDG